MKKTILKYVILALIYFYVVPNAYSQEDWETLWGKTSSNYQQGKYEIAVEFARKALTQAEKEFGKGSYQYAGTQNFLGLLYNELEEYLNAEPLYVESAEIFKKLVGEGHPNYGQAMINLGNLYHKINNYEKAENNYKVALLIYEQNYGADSKEYAIPLINLARLYNDKQEYDNAEKNFIDALFIYKESFGQGDMNYITPLFELASIYKVKKEYKKAEPLYNEIMLIFRQLYGENTVEYAHALSNLADINDILGNHEEAEKWLDTALVIYEENYGKNHQYYYKTIQSLARVYNNQGNYEQAKQNWYLILDQYLNQINNFFPSLSESEKGTFYSNISPYFEEFNSFVLKWYEKYPTLLDKMYDSQLATKAILLNASSKVRRRILNSGDPQLIEKFESWLSVKEKLSKFYTLSKERIEKGKINIPLFEKKANLLERELTKASELFAKEFTKDAVSWIDIQSQLKENEIAIEIVRFRHYNKNWTDSVFYTALLVASGMTHPKPIIIKNGNELDDEYLRCYKNMIRHQLFDRDSYHAFWEMIHNNIPSKISKAYVSLDGIYNQINLSSLQLPSRNYLLDTLEIHIVHNTRKLVEKDEISKETTANIAELFGNPDFEFDKSKEKMAMLDNTKNTDEMMKLNLGENKPWDNFKLTKANQEIKEIKISDLPGTAQEIEEIEELLTEKTWKTKKYLKEEAREKNIKLVKNPKVLHIATHGFFLKDLNENPESKVFGVNTEQAIENPLLRSGLLFAGATVEISGNSADSDLSDNDNGILTAYEAMNLDLDKTELVILSACETGLGEVKNGEGVYGLQRAFEVAGAKTVIMSLWTVSDVATRDLMTAFYEQWVESGNKRTAFKEAQLFMKEKYGWPYYWGAFVMVGD